MRVLRRPSVVRWLLSALVLVVGIGATQWAVRQDVNRQQSTAIIRAQGVAGQFRERLESGVESSYYLTHALDVYVRDLGGELSPAQTSGFLRGLSEHSRHLKLIAVAPGNRIAFVEPVAGNQAAVGLYYPDVPGQWPAIKAVIESGEPSLIGPIALVQGGRGLAYRIPVFLPGSGYWGMVSTIIDADAYLAEASSIGGLSDVRAALRPIEQNGEPGQSFWGDPTAFEGEPVLVDVSPLDATWQLAVVPQSIDTASAQPTRIRGYSLSVILALLVFALIGSRQRRREVSQRLAKLSAQVPGTLFQLRMRPDGTSSMPYASGGVVEQFGLRPEALAADATPMWERVAADDIDRARATLLASAESGQPWHERLRMIDANGTERWFLAEAAPAAEPGGDLVWHGFLMDVSDEVMAEDRLRVSASVMASTRDGVVIMDADGCIVDVNPGFTALTGYPLEDVRGRTLDVLGDGLTPPMVFEDMRAHLERHGFWRGELVYRKRDGRVWSEAVAVTAVRDEAGALSHHVAVISALNTLRDDLVTGLPSRQVLDDRLTQAVDRALATDGYVALIVIGIDQFRDINETLGHRVGDLVLKEAATRLRAAVPEPETVARLGGDEFAIILSEAADEATVERTVMTAVQILSEPLAIGGSTVHSTASAGISVYPADAGSAAELLTHANQAMRAAKDQGRNRYRYSTEAMQAEALERAALTEDLRQALGLGQIHVAYQPVIELATGRVRKAEALVRWQHPVRGAVGPGVFIPIAEKSGLITSLGDEVFTEVLAMSRMLRGHEPDFEVSFNMSPVEVSDEGRLHEDRLEQMRRAGVPAGALVVEITEGLLLDRSEVAVSNLRAYREAGAQFAIDDFGTGYSSLSYLQELDVDYLKIDRSFVSDLSRESESLALCEAIIEMAHKLGLLVIAEGIETEEQRDLLTAASCDFGQGYLFSRPIPGDDLTAMVARQQD